MNERYIPINKGNYSMDTAERELLLEENLGSGWPEGYRQYRHDWQAYPKQQFVSDYPLLVDIELAGSMRFQTFEPISVGREPC